MTFFDNSVCWETNDKMVRAMDQVDEEKDPLNRVTLNVISVAQLEKICCRLCNKKHQIIVHEGSRVLTVASITVGRDHDYQTATVVAHTVAVVNDHAG